MKKVIFKNEVGRSMVEMLGVLAVIGILSIGGISGYTTSMNKHKANTIVNSFMQRAVDVSAQIQSGNKNPNLFAFSDNEIYGATFSTEVKMLESNQFSISISGVDEKVVPQIQQLVLGGKTPVDVVQITGNKVTFIYNNDLSLKTGS